MFRTAMILLVLVITTPCQAGLLRWQPIIQRPAMTWRGDWVPRKHVQHKVCRVYKCRTNL